MNCDRIAPFYQWFEKAAFGTILQKHRLRYIDAAGGKSRALVLGDGDGRFLQALAARYPKLEIDCIELSSGMVAQIRRRVTSQNVRIVQADAHYHAFSDGAYDIVFTHFFLDCFETPQLHALANHLSQALKADATWIISDFRQAHGGWRKYYSTAWLKVMYRFFRLTTGLETRNLPNHAAVLQSIRFRKVQETTSMAGLVASELWLRR